MVSPAAHTPHFSIEPRCAQRLPVSSPVRLGWINDEKRMEYADGHTIDISITGLGVYLPRRMRISALVHLEIPERQVFLLGRVRNCVHCNDGWRVGIELVADAATVS
jgi:hypothetical protein